MSRQHQLPLTRPSVIKEASQGVWDRFWSLYLEPCLEEISLDLRRVGIRNIQPEELFDQLYHAVTKPAKFNKKYRELLQNAGNDPDYQGNLPAKHHYLLLALSGRSTPRAAKFRTLIRRVICRAVTAKRRELIDSEQQRRRCLSIQQQNVALRNSQPLANVDVWVDRMWITEILRDTCRDFFHLCDNAKTKAPGRFPHLLYYSLVEEWTLEQIAVRRELDRSWVSRQLMAAEMRFANCLNRQYAADEKEDVQRVLTAQKGGLIIALYQEEYQRHYEDHASTVTAK